jgi:hypothetical protein
MRTRRGQLQIAETLVSVSLMLILALLLINAADQANNAYSDLTNLQHTASDVLWTADEAGLLRPVIYLYNQPEFASNFTDYHNNLGEYISSVLPDSYGYVLRISEVVNQVVSEEYIYLIGIEDDIRALQNNPEGGVQATYFVGSFSSGYFGIFTNQYLVELYLWEKI